MHNKLSVVEADGVQFKSKKKLKRELWFRQQALYQKQRELADTSNSVVGDKINVINTSVIEPSSVVQKTTPYKHIPNLSNFTIVGSKNKFKNKFGKKNFSNLINKTILKKKIYN